MILAFDIGNTNIKAGLFREDKLLCSMRLTSSDKKTGDEYWVLIRDILLKESGIAPRDITGVIIASVKPNLNYTIEHMVSYYLGLKPVIVGSGIKTGLNVKYDNPKEAGADRIVACVAAFYAYGGPCIVLDCGTATTVSVVSGNGEFLGGPISFGLKGASDALSSSAAKLPKVELIFPDRLVNKSTIANMQAGMLYGYVGLIEYLINKVKAETGEAKVIATGGIAELVAKKSKVIDVLDRALTLNGLNIIYRMNLPVF
jgi:type III pantothenate kinase